MTESSRSRSEGPRGPSEPTLDPLLYGFSRDFPRDRGSRYNTHLIWQLSLLALEGQEACSPRE